MAINKTNEDLITKCKLLPCISTIEDCRKFYKIFFDQNLYDVNYGEKDHKDYRDKLIEELTLDEVLTSYTVIQREDHWEGGNDFVFERCLENKTFERLCKRLQELCSDKK